MFGTQSNTVASLRFTRWSRSKAAAFHSLSRSVSIGRLAVHILRRLERKTMGIHSSTLHQLVLILCGALEDCDMDDGLPDHALSAWALCSTTLPSQPHTSVPCPAEGAMYRLHIPVWLPIRNYSDR